MDVHPSRELVASGQRGGRERKSLAHVRIWSTESLQTLYVFGMGELDISVTSVAFSQLVRKIYAHCTYAVFCGRCVGGVCYIVAPYRMRIQNGGSYILAVDGGRESILSVWQWQWGHLLGKVAVSVVVVCRCDKPSGFLSNKQFGPPVMWVNMHSLRKECVHYCVHVRAVCFLRMFG